MPSVPSYEQPRVQLQGMPNVRVGANAPLDAFGGGDAAARATGAGQQAFGELADIGEKEAQKANQVAFMAADQQASQLQTQIQVSTAKMQGKDAFGAPDYMQAQWSKGVEDIQKGLANENQRVMFAKAVSQRYEELNKSVQVHVGQQAMAYDDQQTQGYIETSRNSAVVNFADDDKVGLEIGRQKMALEAWAVRHGMPLDSPAFQAHQAEQLSATHKGVIAARADAGDVQSAQDYMDANKTSMTAADVLHANKIIESGEVTDEGNAAWSKYKGITLADGTPDLEAIEAKVRSDSELSPKRVEKVVQFVKARAGESMANQNRADAANDRQFMNDVLQARKSGQPMDQALQLTQQYGKDDYDESVKADAIRKIYAPPAQSDPGTYMQLWEGVQNGTVNKQQIDAAKDKNMLNVANWEQLRKDYDKGQIEGRSPQEKEMNLRIKVLARDKFGNDKDRTDLFMYSLISQTHDASPDERWKIANDQLKTVEGSGWFGTNFGGTPIWQANQQKLDAQNLAWGKVHEDLGQDQANAIGTGVLSANPAQKTWDLADVEAFAQRYGGYDKIKTGTPVNNAIVSLKNHGYPAAPVNIDWLLNKHPDGIWR